jgi:hypothetical protein
MKAGPCYSVALYRANFRPNEPLAKSSSTTDDSDGGGIFPCRGWLALQRNSVWSIFGYGRHEDFAFRTRRDRGYPVLIQFFGFSLAPYVMSLRI